MSETDPWKVAKSTIRARIADYSVALLGHSSGSQQAKENAQTAIDVAIDAARAAEAAQHQQALADADIAFAHSGEVIEKQDAQIDMLKQLLHESRARLAAVEAERDHAQNKADVRGNMLRYIAFVTTGDENGDGQLGVDRLRAERDRLNAALRQAAQDLETVGNDYPGSSCWQWCAGRAAVARAALTPQESTDGETR